MSESENSFKKNDINDDSERLQRARRRLIVATVFFVLCNGLGIYLLMKDGGAAEPQDTPGQEESR